MRFWDALTGRSRPPAPRLDALFTVPTAAITLQTAVGLTPTGSGSVCYRGAAGAAFGFTWLTTQGDPSDISGLVTDLHAVNTTLELNGFGNGLLCTLVPFADDAGRRVGLVYLYKQATFYPFAPVPGARRRDNLLEITVRDALASELPIESDLSRWLAVWGAPGL